MIEVELIWACKYFSLFLLTKKDHPSQVFIYVLRTHVYFLLDLNGVRTGS